MPSFGRKSKEMLETTCEEIQEIANEVIKEMDISCISGFRGEIEQNELFKKGFSKLKYPSSAHNQNPSLAGDFCPFPCNWNDKEDFTRMRELFYYHAGRLGYKLKPLIIFSNGGGDYPHIEIEK